MYAVHEMIKRKKEEEMKQAKEVWEARKESEQKAVDSEKINREEAEQQKDIKGRMNEERSVFICVSRPLCVLTALICLGGTGGNSHRCVCDSVRFSECVCVCVLVSVLVSVCVCVCVCVE